MMSSISLITLVPSHHVLSPQPSFNLLTGWWDEFQVVCPPRQCNPILSSSMALCASCQDTVGACRSIQGGCTSLKSPESIWIVSDLHSMTILVNQIPLLYSTLHWVVGMGERSQIFQGDASVAWEQRKRSINSDSSHSRYSSTATVLLLHNSAWAAFYLMFLPIKRKTKFRESPCNWFRQMHVVEANCWSCRNAS